MEIGKRYSISRNHRGGRVSKERHGTLVEASKLFYRFKIHGKAGDYNETFLRHQLFEGDYIIRDEQGEQVKFKHTGKTVKITKDNTTRRIY